MKVRRKPVVFHAVQWFKDGDHPKVIMFSHSDGYQSGSWFPAAIVTGGPVRVTPGCWIVTKESGDVVDVYTDGVFWEMYEPVEQEQQHGQRARG